VKSGQLKVLGVATEKRTRLAPELPTLHESLPGLHANSWYGLFAPAGTPKAVVERIAELGNRVITPPDFAERLGGQGAEVAGSTPAELARLLQDELKMWAAIVKASGATID
jgi:tripartite-type tricarboxylate transporter receptor subunit TctC